MVVKYVVDFIIGLTIRIVASLIQVGWPAKETYQNLVSGEPNKQWLSYWSVYFLIFVAEQFLGPLPRFYTYIIAKTVLCVWLWHKNYLGATLIYERYLKEFYQTLHGKYGKQIEPYLGHKEHIKKD